MSDKRRSNGKSAPKGDRMIRVSPTMQPQERPLHTPVKQSCAHNRLIDDILDSEGTKTGQVLCLECKARFADPAFFKPTR